MRVVNEFAEQPDTPCSLEFLELAQELMQDNNLTFPQNCKEALALYVDLVELIQQLV